ncbi:AAA family ATPase [Dyella lutea]|uniref:AAA family ATPase n=1 Tax=Dyella lutea TaxID=2950441 RepID=A0ABT1FDE0_9GAMM|nr:AAA family ATPase [Dyella lutea]MCP1375354.1 AAA family ATPase [Dyella lutea]
MTDTANVTQIYQGDAELRDQIRSILTTDKRLSQALLSKEAGFSAATLNQWLLGKYAGDNESIDNKLRIWLDAHNSRRAARNAMPVAPDFVVTPTAKRILGTLGYAQMAGDMAVIYGNPGVSKSDTNKYYSKNSPNVWIATMTPSTSGVVTALQEIAEALGLDADGGARAIKKRICKRVLDTNGLLICDEAQHLSVAALDEIRAIHDATGVAIALVGNEGVFARMHGGREATKLDRLQSRIGKRLKIPQATTEDIKALIAAWGITDEKCERTLVEIARRPGALRTLTKTLRLASMYAAAEGRAVCCEDVRAAATELMDGGK